jgi:hypothetical protein
MKVASLLFGLVLLLTVSLSAQIDLAVQVTGGPLPGVIDNFSTISEEPRTWSSVDCNSAEVFVVDADPNDAGNPAGKFTSSSCTDEGFEMDQTFLPFDFSFHTHISLSVFPPAADKKVAVKMFSSTDAAALKIVEVMTTRTAEWDTLHFDFSDAEAGMYDRISVHPDFGETTEGEEWWIDNIRHTRGGLLAVPNDGIIANFDTVVPYLHNWGSDNTEFIVDVNPDTTGINPSKTCGVMFTAADVAWEGFAIAEKFDPLDLEIFNQARVKVLAPDANLPFMFKVELWEDSGVNVETTVQTAVGGEWEEIIFDLTGIEAFKYTKIALFPDFLGTGEGDDWYMDDVMLTDAANVAVDNNARVIKVFALSAKNYPNPYNPTTTISYNVPLPGNVKVSVFDMTGREIQTLVDRDHSQGEHTVAFDASNLASGVYLYKVESSYDVVTNKMVLMR